MTTTDYGTRQAEKGRSSRPTGARLNERKAAILEAVVTEYIGTAQPVGSQHIAGVPGVNVSSATVRSEMAALESEGYLVQPHTSAGRIPTDKGYRFFVDNMASPGVLGPAQRQKVYRFFDQVHGEMGEMLERASRLLSDLTSCAAVVMGPPHDSAVIRSVQLVGLGPRSVLVVIVLSDGTVDKCSVELTNDASDELLEAASRRLQSEFVGAPVLAVGPLGRSGNSDVDDVAEIAAHVVSEIGQKGVCDQIFVGGPSRLAVAFDAVETVRSVMTILEQQMVVVSLLRDVMDRGLSVAIGEEHGFAPLASCAVVVAPVSVDGHDAGAVGLLGPTRMNYPQALAAAHMVGDRLGARIAQRLGSGVTPQTTATDRSSDRG
ncbi:MAG: heat-inducible transcriptional repressor HrcA [Acidimicrobiales bacterium]